MSRGGALCVLAAVLLSTTGTAANYGGHNGGLSDALLLQEMVERMGTDLTGPSDDYLPRLPQEMQPRNHKSYYDSGLTDDELELRDTLNFAASRSLRDGLDLPSSQDLQDNLDLEESQDLLSVARDLRDGLEEEAMPYVGGLAMHPSLRDREYMSHGGHLLGNMLAQIPPGSSYGTMRIKPSNGGAPPATTERKTDGSLPAYCNPPNPCPLHYSASDGCEEQFENTAAFSRSYQAEQECMCDTEHMFDCPDSSQDSELGALARSIQNEGVLDSTLDKIMEEMTRNPYLQGAKLPVAAKKGDFAKA